MNNKLMKLWINTYISRGIEYNEIRADFSHDIHFAVEISDISKPQTIASALNNLAGMINSYEFIPSTEIFNQNPLGIKFPLPSQYD